VVGEKELCWSCEKVIFAAERVAHKNVAFHSRCLSRYVKNPSLKPIPSPLTRVPSSSRPLQANTTQGPRPTFGQSESTTPVSDEKPSIPDLSRDKFCAYCGFARDKELTYCFCGDCGGKFD